MIQGSNACGRRDHSIEQRFGRKSFGGEKSQLLRKSMWNQVGLFMVGIREPTVRALSACVKRGLRTATNFIWILYHAE
jgi:hypothetical protein